MSMRILVTPEELEGIAQQFKNGSDASRQQTAQLYQALQSLEGKWDGATKKRFFDQFEQSRRHMEAYVQLLDSIDQELRAIATRFRQADAQ
ncbi:WXG100 family type VII secretion target [Aneurinibacillus aneurinilyticus]|uniref:ESAT-6-like protein n=2 Tax=Aneurinibacillus aneurinilyticus TaxID=1391 RepID=A0A848CZX4_ANEAE|nr:WXG100 family type VII secretion target [Aneurinibacillus aneurinilyticus]MCI1696621.1 WXG100 family type VII secretion target [Aneurinibacillus aneurinilyticus]MED0668923.1 WXG100 family type VII secretion target [Aneurinibacillus aneurinilyticus]MED0705530.1 WXG100 family type VII secretion target [Aneurinibacillus aneurinilyticus]MED0723148.1 WXG100 family type VII secretion target [Aneurinibacillus aneurinilyticus]MED0731582.1 WXG100 family type VII secretion target [Aneurinibacillus an